MRQSQGGFCHRFLELLGPPGGSSGFHGRAHIAQSWPARCVGWSFPAHLLLDAINRETIERSSWRNAQARSVPEPSVLATRVARPAATADKLPTNLVLLAPAAAGPERKHAAAGNRFHGYEACNVESTADSRSSARWCYSTSMSCVCLAVSLRSVGELRCERFGSGGNARASCLILEGFSNQGATVVIAFLLRKLLPSFLKLLVLDEATL